MKRTILLGIPLVVLIVLVGWRFAQKSETLKTLEAHSSQTKNGPANVMVAYAGRRAINKTIECVGTIDSPFVVELSPKLVGKIVYLPDNLREGTVVTKGEILCKVDPTETQGQVLQAFAQWKQSQATYEHDLQLQHPYNENIISQIAQDQATIDSNVADWRQVKETFESLVHQAQSGVVDSKAKLDAAVAAVYNAQASLGSAKASLDAAQSLLTRDTTLYKQGFIAAQDLDNQIAAQKVAAANVKVADGQVQSAKSAQNSADAELKQAQDNEAIVRKNGETNIDAAWGKVVLAKAALKYAESAYNQKPAYVAQLDADKAAARAAQGNLNQAQARLADCDLVATIDGSITHRNADLGMVITPGNSILEIQYLKWLYDDSAVPIEYAGIIAKGTPVTMTCDAVPGVKLTGTVSDLSNAADPQARQFTAKIRFDNPDLKFRTGMYSTVRFQVSRKFYPVVVPREAVKTSNDGKSTVTMVDAKNVAHIVPVTLGEQDTSNIVITKGLSPGDKVVVLSYTPVREGQKITDGSKGKKGGTAAPANGAESNQETAGIPKGGGSELTQANSASPSSGDSGTQVGSATQSGSGR